MRRFHSPEALGLLPTFVSAPRLSGRVWVAMAAGLGCGVAAYAGLYPRFDNGALRIVVALTSAPFGAALAAFALAARTWGRAFWRAVVMAAVLGVAVTILPGLYLARHQHDAYPLVLVFGLLFGAPTGAVYGLPVAVLVAMTRRSVAEASHAGADRAAGLGALWLALAALFAASATLFLDVNARFPSPDYEVEYDVAVGPLVVEGVLLLAALVVLATTTWRTRMRARWIGRVKSGGERRFRVRPIDARDDVSALPLLAVAEATDAGATDAAMVVEWTGTRTGDESTAYRMPAMGTAVALLAEGRAVDETSRGAGIKRARRARSEASRSSAVS